MSLGNLDNGELIRLDWGWPSLSLNPVEMMSQACTNLFDPSKALASDALHYGNFPGSDRFLGSLSSFLTSEYGHPVAPKSLFLTAGAGATIDMACTLLTQAGDTVLTQKATYQNALKIFKNHRLRVESLAEFPDGTLDLDTIKTQLSAASASTKLIYLIPTFANPTGRSLDGSTKRVLVDLAQANNLTILADEVYHLLRFPKSEAPPPVMSHFDTDGTTVLSLGSFTKIIAPGLRIGWAHAKSEMPLNKSDTGHLLHKLLHHGVIQNGGAVNHFTSMLIANTVDNGDLSGHLNHLRSTYEKRASILYQALSEKIPKQWIEFEPATGGYYLWLKLTPQCPFSAADLLLASQHSGLHFRTGAQFSPSSQINQANGVAECLRICFAYYDAPQLEKSAEILAEVIRKLSKPT